MLVWKEVQKIDAHIHILPDAVIAANQGNGDPLVEAGSVDAYIQTMDENHITKAIIMPFNDPFLMSMEFTVSAVHNNLISFQKKYPNRFLVFADVDVRNSIDKTIKEFDRIWQTGVFSGIKIHPNNTGMAIDCDYFDKIFVYAEANNIPVEVHSYPSAENPQDVSAPVRIRRVLEKYPTLRLCAAHLGGMQLEDLLGSNIWVDISAVLPDLAAHFGIRKTNELLRKFGTDKLVFATDYPDSRSLSHNTIYESYFDILDRMDFSDDEIRMICRENVLQFLGKI